MADIKDAICLIPLPRREPEFFVARHRWRWLVFMRIAQGSRGAPLSWASIAALIGRCIQSLFDIDVAATEFEAKLQLCVDDLLLSAVGAEQRYRRLAVMFCVAFFVLGCELALNKTSARARFLGLVHAYASARDALKPPYLQRRFPNS